MLKSVKSHENEYTGVEIPSKYRNLTNFLCITQHSVVLPIEELTVDEMLYLCRMDKTKILTLRIQDGDEGVVFSNVINTPRHTPEWYRLQNF